MKKLPISTLLACICGLLFLLLSVSIWQYIMLAQQLATQQDKDAVNQAQRDKFFKWKDTPNHDGKVF